jgi:hypothetical protein
LARRNLIYEGVIMQTCKGKARTGAACRAPAGSGGLCFFHANPDSAKTLGQIGGRKNRRSAVDLEVPENMTAADLCTVTGQVMRLLLSGELGAREASAFAQLSNSLHRIIPTADLEARITMMEEQIAQEGQGAQEEDGIVSGPTTDRTELAETYGSVEAEQSTCSTDTTMEDGDETESVVDEPSEGEEAQ